MDDTKPIIPQELHKALVLANRAARIASEGDDGGTCNLDAVVLRVPKGTRKALIEGVARDAGIPATETEWLGRGFFLGFDTGGQADARYRGVQAALAVMREHGFEVNYYAAID